MNDHLYLLSGVLLVRIQLDLQVNPRRSFTDTSHSVGKHQYATHRGQQLGLIQQTTTYAIGVVVESEIGNLLCWNKQNLSTHVR